MRRWEKGEKHVLDVDSLGKPGEIVVVPQTPRRLTEADQPGDVTDEGSNGVTIRSLLDDLHIERSLDHRVVKERIENCRGSYQRFDKLPAGDWEDLRSRLDSSFTIRQLSDYVSEYRQPRSEPNEGASQHPAVNVGSWEPVTSKSATSRALTGKALLAEKILRNCWRLSIDSEVGQFDLQLSSQFLSLLRNSDHFSFDEVASLHGASIDIINARGLVRVIGKQNACQSITEIVLDAAARIREEDVEFGANSVSAGNNQTFNPEFLEWINKTYGVVLEPKSNVPQKILYLAENKFGAHNARRTLNLALYSTAPTSIPFSTYLPASEPASVYNLNPEENASWFDRQKTWFRWAMPSAQAAEGEAHSTPFFDQHQSRLSDKLLKLLRDVPVAQAGSGGDMDVHTSVTAAVGRCLFMRKPSFEKTAISASQLGRLSVPRTFTTDIPRISPFIDSLFSIPPTDNAQPYRVRLTPTTVYAGVFPPLEIEFSVTDDPVDSESDLVIRSVKAILGTNSVDYLLPENGLDLRFTRTVHRDLLDESHSNPSDSPSHQAMLQSIQQSLRSLLGANGGEGNSNSLSSFCYISIPNDFLQGPASKSCDVSQTCGENDAAQHTNTVTVEYMFPPLNNIWDMAVRQYDFLDKRLNYSFYESGPFLAAHTMEVTLDMKIPRNGSTADNEPSDEMLEQDFHSLYKAACAMAFGIHQGRDVEVLWDIYNRMVDD